MCLELISACLELVVSCVPPKVQQATGYLDGDQPLCRLGIPRAVDGGQGGVKVSDQIVSLF